MNLPKGLFLPVDRSDVLEIATHQDRIANRARDIAGLVMGRRMSIPAVIAPFFMAFLKRSIDATVQAKKIIDELDELLETGFRGDEADLVRKMVMTLDEIEHDTDEMQIEVRGELFRIETQLPPIDVVFLYKIIDRTGDLADQAQIVGGQLLLLLAR